MGKNKGGKGGDARARDKVDHRAGGGRNKRGAHAEAEEVPQELIDKAARFGCEIWEVEEYER